MKQFTTIKIGYTAGVYGCSNEYFTTIAINGTKHETFSFYGMYGAEERIAGAMKKKGYTEFYTPSYYGRMTRSDVPKRAAMTEYSAVEYIQRGFKESEKEIEAQRKELESITKKYQTA